LVTNVCLGSNRERQEEIKRLQQDIKNLNSDTAEERRKEEEARKKAKKVSLIESERAKYKRNNKAILGGIKGRKKSRVGNDDDVSFSSLCAPHFLTLS
jgi:hypothetical protein